jgi:hypothetical protein
MNAPTPTREPYDAVLSQQERATVEVRLAAFRAARVGASMEVALSEVSYAYKIERSAR